MQDSSQQVTLTIIAAVGALLLLGLLFLVVISYSNNQKIRMIRESQQLKGQFDNLLLQVKLESQEEAFNQISQEIHDNVGQLLSLAKVQLNILEERKVLDISLIGDAKENMGRALGTLRDIAASLNGSQNQLMSLPLAVGEELDRLQRGGVIKTRFQVTGLEADFSQQEKLVLFRIIQESLHNALKHAQASELAVAFEYSGGACRVRIEDKGTGFDFAEVRKNNGGMGLQNILDRARLIGAQVSIESEIGKGTTITIIKKHV